MPSLPPRYFAVKPIGASRKAWVWKAYDSQDDRMVAIKVARDRDLTPGQRNSLDWEVELGSAVTHKNVVRVLDAHTSGDSYAPYVVSELVEGRSLAHVLKRRGPLTPEQTAVVGAQLAMGLAAVHRKLIVHRDMKPDNVLVSLDGLTKLTDFGIAKSTAPGGPGTDNAVGTPGYLTPEMARAMLAARPGEGKRPAPPAQADADLYALGLVLHAAMTGQPPLSARLRTRPIPGSRGFRTSSRGYRRSSTRRWHI